MLSSHSRLVGQVGLQSYQRGLINNNNIDALEEAEGGGGFISERQEDMFDSTRSRVKPFKE